MKTLLGWFLAGLVLLPVAFGAKTKIADPKSDMFHALKSNISDVTVFSDRAQIKRSAEIKLNGGESWFEIGPLPFELDRRSLSIASENKNIHISQMQLFDTFEKNSLRKELELKLEELEVLYKKRLDADQMYQLLLLPYQFLDRLSFKVPVNNQHEEFPLYNAERGDIEEIFGSMESERRKLQLDLGKVRETIADIDRSIERLSNELSHYTDTSKQKWVKKVRLLLKSDGPTRGTINLGYRLPNAKWHPVYDLRTKINVEKGKAEIQLVMNALVEQHTGENWQKAKVSLSAADPMPLFLPKLKRWEFTEIREEDVGHARNEESKLMMFAKQSPNSPAATREGRMQKKVAVDQPARARMNRQEQLQEKVAQESDSVAGLSYEDSAGGSAPEAQMVAPSIVATPRENNSQGMLALRSLDQIYPVLGNLKRGVSAGWKEAEQQTWLKPERDKAQWERNTYHDSTLPAMQVGGRNISFQSPFLLDLPHDAPPSKIYLKNEELLADLTYLAIPKKDRRVFLEGKAKNSTKSPILLGMAQVYMNGNLVMKTQLPTMIPGGAFNINLGVDDNVKSERISKKMSSDKGMVFKEHETEVDVTIQIANNHPFPINIRVKDNYPLSPKSEIKVDLVKVSPTPVYEKDGIIEWDAKIDARKKMAFTFKYKVNHPQSYLVSEFD